MSDLNINVTHSPRLQLVVPISAAGTTAIATPISHIPTSPACGSTPPETRALLASSLTYPSNQNAVPSVQVVAPAPGSRPTSPPIVHMLSHVSHPSSSHRVSNGIARVQVQPVWRAPASSRSSPPPQSHFRASSTIEPTNNSNSSDDTPISQVGATGSHNPPASIGAVTFHTESRQ